MLNPLFEIVTEGTEPKTKHSLILRNMNEETSPEESDVVINEGFREFIPVLKKVMQSKLEQIRKESEKGEFEKVSEVALQIKGVAGTLGFDPVYDLAGEIEEHATNGEADKIQSKTSAIAESLNQATIQYE